MRSQCVSMGVQLAIQPKHARGCEKSAAGKTKHVQRCVMCRNTRHEHPFPARFNKYTECCYITNPKVCGVCMQSLEGEFVGGLAECVADSGGISHLDLCNKKLRGKSHNDSVFGRRDVARSFFLTLLDKLSTGPTSVYQVFNEFNCEGSTLSRDLVLLSREWWLT